MPHIASDRHRTLQTRFEAAPWALQTRAEAAPTADLADIPQRPSSELPPAHWGDPAAYEFRPVHAKSYCLVCWKFPMIGMCSPRNTMAGCDGSSPQFWNAQATPRCPHHGGLDSAMTLHHQQPAAPRLRPTASPGPAAMSPMRPTASPGPRSGAPLSALASRRSGQWRGPLTPRPSTARAILLLPSRAPQPHPPALPGTAAWPRRRLSRGCSKSRISESPGDTSNATATWTALCSSRALASAWSCTPSRFRTT